MEFITLLLPLLTQLLPLILNKPEDVAKQACLRKVVRYTRAAEAPDTSAADAAVFGELADLFACLAEADSAGRLEIAAGINTASTEMRSMMAI